MACKQYNRDDKDTGSKSELSCKPNWMKTTKSLMYETPTQLLTQATFDQKQTITIQNQRFPDQQYIILYFFYKKKGEKEHIRRKIIPVNQEIRKTNHL